MIRPQSNFRKTKALIELYKIYIIYQVEINNEKLLRDTETDDIILFIIVFKALVWL